MKALTLFFSALLIIANAAPAAPMPDTDTIPGSLDPITTEIPIAAPGHLSWKWTWGSQAACSLSSG